MRDIFIADAHLKNGQDTAYVQLLEFLKQNRENIGNLILLGDFFEFWIGYKSSVYHNYIAILHELQTLSEYGTRIIMVEGNHDFNVGPYFSDTLNAEIIPDGKAITLGNNLIWVEHGDLINANNKYRILRTVLRSFPVRCLSQVLHPDLVWRIADFFSAWSKKQRNSSANNTTCNTSFLLPKQKIRALAQKYSRRGCTSFICGHFHQSWHESGTHTNSIVVGTWADHGTYLEHSDGHFELKHFF